YLSLYVLACMRVAVGFGKLLCYAESHAARNNSHFVDRVCVRDLYAYKGVAGLVIGCVALLFVADNDRAALAAHQDLVLGRLKIAHRHDLAVVTGSVEGSFVYKVGKI